MAVATGTAIAIGSAVATAASATKSFIDAGKQKKLQKEAEQSADQAMQEARKKLEINFYDQLAINKEPYELQREAMAAQGAEAVQAAQESERGVAATAGRVQMAVNQGEADIRTQMGKEMSDIQKMQLAEESRLRDVGAQLDLSEAEGAQMAARDAQEANAAMMAQGFQGVQSVVQQGVDQLALYDKQKIKTPQTPVPLAAGRAPSASAINPVKTIPADGNIFGNNPFGVQTPKPLLPYGATSLPSSQGPLAANAYNPNPFDFTGTFLPLQRR